MTERALDELMSADLSELDLVALMIDGVHFAEHLCVVALGISIDGNRLCFEFGADQRTVELSAGQLHRRLSKQMTTGT